MTLKLKPAVPVVVLFSAVAVLLACGTLFGQSSKTQAKAVQSVKLTFDAKGYVVTPAKLTKGVPVKMEVDLATVKGCMRTVVISAYNVNKTVKEGDTTIEFTPTTTGEIQIVCGMNMGKGSFTVVEPTNPQ
jgi:plastocyanin domain-containing protein